MKALQASTYGAPQTARARSPALSFSSSLGPAGANPVQSGTRERNSVSGGGGGDSGSGMADETATSSSSEKIKHWSRRDLLMAADEITSSSAEKIKRLKDTLSSRWH
jgi:hypothetical protein